jgi:hypothetical protein
MTWLADPARRILRVAAAGALALTATATAGCGLLGGDGDSSWEEAAAQIDGIVNYRVERPDLVEPGHVEGKVFYEVRPPVGGQHFATWQDCNGQVYEAPLIDEYAVHSLEHGAVWITYRPDLPDDQVEALAARVRDTEKLFLSPYPGLQVPISLQAWGYQLALEDAGDDRIDTFIRALRVNASPEGPTAPCTGGTDATQ